MINSDLDARLALAMGWRAMQTVLVENESVLCGTRPDRTAAPVPRYSESLDAQAPLMAEIRKRGLIGKWAATLFQAVHDDKLDLLDTWVALADAPAVTRAQVCLKVLEGE